MEVVRLSAVVLVVYEASEASIAGSNPSGICGLVQVLHLPSLVSWLGRSNIYSSYDMISSRNMSSSMAR